LLGIYYRIITGFISKMCFFRRAQTCSIGKLSSTPNSFSWFLSNFFNVFISTILLKKTFSFVDNYSRRFLKLYFGIFNFDLPKILKTRFTFYQKRRWSKKSKHAYYPKCFWQTEKKTHTHIIIQPIYSLVLLRI